jgi:hypothetical protein
MAELEFIEFLNRLSTDNALSVVLATTYRDWLREAHAAGVDEHYSQRIAALKQLFERKFGPLMKLESKLPVKPSELTHKHRIKQPPPDPFEKEFGKWASSFSTSDDEKNDEEVVDAIAPDK